MPQLMAMRVSRPSADFSAAFARETSLSALSQKSRIPMLSFRGLS